MMIYATPFSVWVKALTNEERNDLKLIYKDYDNPLYKAYCAEWQRETEGEVN